MTENLCSLVANGLDLTVGPYQALADDVTFGNPEPLTTSMRGLLQDGSTVSVSGHDNREMFFRVSIRATDGQALAEAEAALVRATTGRFPLVWTPPDQWGRPTVFDVQHCELTFLFDDLSETRVERTYGLAMTALPFGRSVDEVLSGAVVIGSTATVVDACESTTGWSFVAPYTGALSIDAAVKDAGAGSLKITSNQYGYSLDSATSHTARTTTRVKRSGLSAVLATGGYVTALVKTDWAVTSRTWITTDVGGTVEVSPLVAEYLPSGFVKYAWQVPFAATVTAIETELTQSQSGLGGLPVYDAPPGVSFHIDSISTAATASSDRQQSRVLDVGGSVRTTGSLEVSATVGLGELLVFTAPDRGDGFRPDTRRWQVQGTTSVDATALTGARATLTPAFDDTGGVNFEIPTRILRQGAYTVVARWLSTTATSVLFDVDASLRIGGVNVGPVQQTGTIETVASGDVDTYRFSAIGVLNLPPVPVNDGSAAVARLRTRSANTTRLDEMWLFPEAGHLTWVDCGTGTPSASGASSRLWIDSPSPDQPRGGLWRGTQLNRSDARSARSVASADEGHVFEPPRMLAFLVSTGAQGAELALRHHPRWHTNAAS